MLALTKNRVSIHLVRWAVVNAIADFCCWSEYDVLTLDDDGGISVTPHWSPNHDPGKDSLLLGAIASAMLVPEIEQSLTADGLGEALRAEDLNPAYIDYLKDKVKWRILPLYEGIETEVFLRLRKTLISDRSIRFNKSEIL